MHFLLSYCMHVFVSLFSFHSHTMTHSYDSHTMTHSHTPTIHIHTLTQLFNALHITASNVLSNFDFLTTINQTSKMAYSLSSKDCNLSSLITIHLLGKKVSSVQHMLLLFSYYQGLSLISQILVSLKSLSTDIGTFQSI